MDVKNDTSDIDPVKICLYRKGDAGGIPVGSGVFTVTRGHPVHWEPPDGEELPQYHMKVFKPQFIDRLLCEGIVGRGGNLAVRGGGDNYRIEVIL